MNRYLQIPHKWYFKVCKDHLEPFLFLPPGSPPGLQFSESAPRFPDPGNALQSKNLYKLWLLSSKALSFSRRKSFVPTGSNTLESIKAWQRRAAFRRDTSLEQNRMFCMRWLRTTSTASAPVKQSLCTRRCCRLRRTSTCVWRAWMILRHNCVARKGPEEPGVRIGKDRETG